MENQFPIGFTNYMDWESSLNAKFAEIIVIGEDDLMRGIFQSGDMDME